MVAGGSGGGAWLGYWLPSFMGCSRTEALMGDCSGILLSGYHAPSTMGGGVVGVRMRWGAPISRPHPSVRRTVFNPAHGFTGEQVRRRGVGLHWRGGVGLRRRCVGLTYIWYRGTSNGGGVIIHVSTTTVPPLHPHRSRTTVRGCGVGASVGLVGERGAGLRRRARH